MAATVVTQNEISLNGVRFRTKGPVQSALSSIYPTKQVTGDYTRDSQARASVHAMSDWRNGIGLSRFRSNEPTNRAWWSTCQLRYHEHLVLPPLATLTAASGSSGQVGAIGELASEIYAAFGTDIRKYNNTNDTWSAVLDTLPAAATHAITFRMNNVVYLAFATTGGYSYSSDGVTFTDDTRDATYLAFWDDRLWGIDSTGLLWYSTAIGVETDDAQLPLPNSSVTSLFVGPLITGEEVIHAGTTYGLYSHDVDNRKFVKTRLSGSQHPDSGKGAIAWRDAHYYPNGTGIQRYGLEGGGAAINVVGPDRDDGLPSDKRGVIKQLIDAVNEMIAIVDGTTTTSVNMFDSESVMSAAEVIEPATGFSHILGWDGRGWEVKWLGGSSAQAISYAYVSYAYSTYRLWWAANQRIYYMSLPRDIINPNEITTFAYAASADHETPWFSAEQVEVDKLALELRVETTGCTSTETATISYGTNYSSSYTQLGVISSNGITSYLFPNSTTPNGTDFRSIRFKVSLARGSTTTLSPDVVSLTLTYRKKLPPKYMHSVTVDLMTEIGGRSAKELRAALITAIEQTTTAELTFRNDAGLTRNYYVDIVQASGLEQTGLDERGESELVMVEP